MNTEATVGFDLKTSIFFSAGRGVILTIHFGSFFLRSYERAASFSKRADLLCVTYVVLIVENKEVIINGRQSGRFIYRSVILSRVNRI